MSTYHGPMVRSHYTRSLYPSTALSGVATSSHNLLKRMKRNVELTTTKEHFDIVAHFNHRPLSLAPGKLYIQHLY